MSETIRSIVIGLGISLVLFVGLNWVTRKSKPPQESVSSSLPQKVVPKKSLVEGASVLKLKENEAKVSRENPGKQLARVGEGGVWENEFRWFLVRFPSEYPDLAKVPRTEMRAVALSAAIDNEILFQAALRNGALRESEMRKRIVDHHRAEYQMSRSKPEDFSDEDVKSYSEKHQMEMMEPPTLAGGVFYFQRSATGSEMERRRQEALTQPNSIVFSKRPEANTWIEFQDFRRQADSTSISEADRAVILGLKVGEVSPPIDLGLTRAVYWIRSVTSPAGAIKRPKVIQALLQEKNKAVMTEWEKNFPTEEAQFQEALRNRTHYYRAIHDQIVNDYVRKMTNHQRGMTSEQMKASKAGVVERVRSGFRVEILD